jgi:COX assembly mitochondrial protein 2
MSFLPLLTDKLGCEEVMYALEECHARGFLYQALGQCNEAKRALNKCLRKARLERSRENFEKSREKNEKLKQMWKNIDENS